MSVRVFERGQFGAANGLNKADGQAGYGIYAYVPSASMRAYYTQRGEDCARIQIKEGHYTVDLTKEKKILIRYIQEKANDTTKAMGGRPVKVNSSNYQIFGRYIQQYVNEKHPIAAGYIVDHKGHGIPTGKQVVITKDEAIEIISINGLKACRSDDADVEISCESHPVTKNPDGSPKIFYHGTNTAFDTFDKSKIGQNTQRADSGIGFYFAHAKEGHMDSGAAWYGQYIMERCLDLKNPLILPDDPVEVVRTIGNALPEVYVNGHSLRKFKEIVEGFMDGFDPAAVSCSNGIFNYKTYHYKGITARNLLPDEDVARRLLVAHMWDEVECGLPLVRDINPHLLAEAVRAAGYDGIYSNDEVVVFEPEQILEVPTAAIKNGHVAKGEAGLFLQGEDNDKNIFKNKR